MGLYFLQHMKLKEIVDNKNYTEIFEDEKELLWKLRSVVCDHYPESLSKLLLITKWNKREDVVQMVGLLRYWPDLPAIHALELLDYSFPDPAVRAFTVRCLRKLRCIHSRVFVHATIAQTSWVFTTSDTFRLRAVMMSCCSI